MELDGIELLVRRSGPGDGPPWLFLHAAGETSRAFAEMAVALGRRGQRVEVPDMPGCGASEGFTGRAPAIDDYAAVIAGLLAEPPSTGWIVYGRHFGARVAIALAAARPEAIACIVLDGLGRYNRRQRARMRRHAAPLVIPDTDGAYLASAFQRVRDYALFFPWFDRTAEARRATGLPEAAVLHDRLLEVLASSTGIRDAYRAALDYPEERHLKASRTPVILARRDGDNVPDPTPALRRLRPDLHTIDVDLRAPEGVADRLLDGVARAAGAARRRRTA